MMKARSRTKKFTLITPPVDKPTSRFKENVDRNAIIYDLWVKDRTIKEIAFETGIPEGSVGYYVVKFNKAARKGNPIIIKNPKKPISDSLLIANYFKKEDLLAEIKQSLNTPKGVDNTKELDKTYKKLMILKLLKDLHRDLFASEEEIQACKRNLPLVDKIVKARKQEKINQEIMGFLKGFKEMNTIENPEQRDLAVKTFCYLCKNKWEEEGLLKKPNPEQSAPS